MVREILYRVVFLWLRFWWRCRNRSKKCRGYVYFSWHFENDGERSIAEDESEENAQEKSAVTPVSVSHKNSFDSEKNRN